MVPSVLDAVEEALPGSYSGLEFFLLDLAMQLSLDYEGMSHSRHVNNYWVGFKGCSYAMAK